MSQSPQSRDIRRLVLAVLEPNPSELYLRRFFRHCHRIAIAYLRRRERSGRLDLEAFGLTLEDLALDCIAELFQRDASGQCVRLQASLHADSWQDGPDAEIAVRRLVFSAVSEGLFRRYQEADPGLGRLIRNLKRHVPQVPEIRLTRVHSILMLSLADAPAGGPSQPTMPFEVMEAYLHADLAAARTPADVLRAWHRLASQESPYAPYCPITALALVVRSVATRVNAVEEAPLASLESPAVAYEHEDLASMVRSDIDRTVQEEEARFRHLYVGERGVEPHVYHVYFETIRDTLYEQFGGVSDEHRSIRASLAAHLGEVSRDAYRRQHQAMVEYLLRVTRTRLLRRLTPQL